MRLTLPLNVIKLASQKASEVAQAVIDAPTTVEVEINLPKLPKLPFKVTRVSSEDSLPSL